MTARRGTNRQLIVMAIMVALISLSVPIFRRSIIRDKETVLKNNLHSLRTVIHEYTNDKRKAPRSLQDLISDAYLRQIPVDPMTRSADSWKIIMEDATNTMNQAEPGIVDVRSGSNKNSLEGTPYSDW